MKGLGINVEIGSQQPSGYDVIQSQLCVGKLDGHDELFLSGGRGGRWLRGMIRARLDEEFAAVEPIDGGAFQVGIGEERVPEESNSA